MMMVRYFSWILGITLFEAICWGFELCSTFFCCGLLIFAAH